MMGKKGFTLIELLAVIAIIGIISLIAIPNIVGISTGIKKDQMLDDAKKLISLAKYKINSNVALRYDSQEFDLTDLNINGDIDLDPDGGKYVSGTVYYEIKNNTPQYCVTLIGSKRGIGIDNCVREEMLYSRSNVVDIDSHNE